MKQLVVLFLWLTFGLQAQDLRILQLLPEVDCPLAVNPYIPRDFVAMSPKGTLNINEWIYWGPKDVLEKYFREPGSLSQPCLRVMRSESVKQISPDSFNRENDELVRAFTSMGIKRMYDVRMKWGSYPIYAITAQFEKKWLYAAWVGLNDAHGSTLLFELVYPGEKPTVSDFEVWNSFLDKTTQLDKPLMSLNYHPGHTALDLYGAKCTFTGEQQYSDKTVQIVVEFEDPTLTYSKERITYEQLNQGGHLTGPAALLQGQFCKTGSPLPLKVHQPIYVMIRPVDKFSIDAQTARNKGSLVFQEKRTCLLREYLGSP